MSHTAEELEAEIRLKIENLEAQIEDIRKNRIASIANRERIEEREWKIEILKDVLELGSTKKKFELTEIWAFHSESDCFLHGTREELMKDLSDGTIVEICEYSEGQDESFPEKVIELARETNRAP